MIVEMKDVSWIRDQKGILENINWQIQKGEHWCLVGLNGSGKTTILDLINGYIWPSKGNISVLGHAFGQTDLRELRKQIGWVSSSLGQRLHEHETAEKIVLSGKYASIGIYQQPDEADRAQALHLLTDWQCEHLIGRTYQTLSQGERQKILIARALMASPKLLILDEPCTGLDIFAREQVLTMIKEVATNPNAPTLIYVTHHIEEIMPCFTHTLLLREGQVALQGLTDEVLTEEQLSAFFQTPLSIEVKNGRRWLSL